MKSLYIIFAASSLLLLAPTAHASAPKNDGPTEMARKATASEKGATAAKATKAVKKSSSRRLHKSKVSVGYKMMVLLGLEESKAVTSPAKLDRQLHANQKHLKAKARLEAKARRRRTVQWFG